MPTDYRKNRLRQTVTLNIRYTSVTIQRSHSVNAKTCPKEVSLNIVEAYQEGQKGISWKLLTTHSIKDYHDAYQVVHWYSERWLIEQMHRLLKHKGFQIEDSELESGWAIRKLCILMLSALLRIIQMNLAYNEEEGGQPINEVFSETEVHGSS